MKKFLLTIAAVAGVSLLAVSGTAQAGPPRGPQWNGNGGYSWNGGPRGYYNAGYGGGRHHRHDCGPVYPVRPIRPAPVVVPQPYPIYQPYPVYNTTPGFGLMTPNFGLFVR